MSVKTHVSLVTCFQIYEILSRCQQYLLRFTVGNEAEPTSRPTKISSSELQHHIETMDEKAYKDEFEVNYHLSGR